MYVYIIFPNYFKEKHFINIISLQEKVQIYLKIRQTDKMIIFYGLSN